jgi:hypothetical protein
MRYDSAADDLKVIETIRARRSRAEAMALHFDREEFDARRRRTLEAMAARGIDALLLFKQERYVS